MDDKNYFADKNIWITGASSGIGEALAKELSKSAGYLILSGRNEERLNAVRNQLASPENAIVITADMRSKDSIEEAAETVLAEVGKIDILINNAGISQRALVRDSSDEVDLAILETNLLGPIRMTKKLLPSMLDNGWGHIVVISSVTGKIGTPYRSSYAASKHGLHGFFDSLRAEESKNGIRVSLVCPGYIRTDISKNALLADGSSKGSYDENSLKGMPSDVFSKKVLRKISRNKAEIIIGGKETMGIYLGRYMPGVLRRILPNIKP